MTKDKKNLGIILLIAGFIAFSSFKNAQSKTKAKAKQYKCKT